mgnify:CR=1 FL=1
MDVQLPRVDAVRLAILADISARGVVAHEPDRGQRERRLKPRQINQHVVGSRRRCARSLGEDVRESVLRRIDVDDLGAIENPVPACEDSIARCARHESLFFLGEAMAAIEEVTNAQMPRLSRSRPYSGRTPV